MKTKNFRKITSIASLLLLALSVVTCVESNSDKVKSGTPTVTKTIKKPEGKIINKEIYNNLLGSTCLIKLDNGQVQELKYDDRIKYNVGDVMYTEQVVTSGGFIRNTKGEILCVLTFIFSLFGTLSFMAYLITFNDDFLIEN